VARGAITVKIDGKYDDKDKVQRSPNDSLIGSRGMAPLTQAEDERINKILQMHANKRTEIVVNFKNLPHNIFKDSFHELPANKLVIHLQPNEGVDVMMLNKVPGIDGNIKLQQTKLDLSFSETFKKSRIFGGYEKLILEALRGNPTLFLSREEIEQAWTWVDEKIY
jgi:glucose-6-phosphate 1-dehydrogenase